MSASRPAKYRGWAARISDASPRTTSRSSAIGGSSPASKTGFAPLTVGDQQRLAHQCVRQIQYAVLVVTESGYRAGAFEVESTGEHRTSFQERLFRVVEQVIRPGHRVAQRVVTFQSAPRTDQQPEPVIKAITHFTGGHRRHPRGGQFDGQWNPIEALTNLSDCGGFIAVEHREARRNALSAFDEQA